MAWWGNMWKNLAMSQNFASLILMQNYESTQKFNLIRRVSENTFSKYSPSPSFANCAPKTKLYWIILNEISKALEKKPKTVPLTVGHGKFSSSAIWFDLCRSLHKLQAPLSMITICVMNGGLFWNNAEDFPSLTNLFWALWHSYIFAFFSSARSCQNPFFNPSWDY